jgi:hypothetical protein
MIEIPVLPEGEDFMPLLNIYDKSYKFTVYGLRFRISRKMDLEDKRKSWKQTYVVAMLEWLQSRRLSK